MNHALEKYADALKNPALSNTAIAKMAKVPEADVVAARAEIAAIEAAAKAPEVVVEVASEIEAVAEAVADVADAVDAPKVEAVAEAVVGAAEIVEHGADLLGRITTGPRIKPRKALDLIFAIFGVTDSDHDGDVDALDAMHAVFAALTKRPPPRVEKVDASALIREPGSAVRALRTARIVDAKGKPWNVMFRDVFSGAQADYLASNHPGLVETYPRPKG